MAPTIPARRARPRCGSHGKDVTQLLQSISVLTKTNPGCRLRAGEVAFFMRAAELQLEVLALIDPVSPDAKPRRLAALIKAGEYTVKAGQLHVALDWYAQALRLQLELGGEATAATANLLDAMGEAHRMAGNAPVALEYYDWALRLRRQVFGETNAIVADTLYNMALLYKRIGAAGRCCFACTGVGWLVVCITRVPGLLPESLAYFGDAAGLLEALHGSQSHPAVQDAHTQVERVRTLMAVRGSGLPAAAESAVV
jgi:tetratricopeptide (TPR) repeat protein